MASSLNSGPIKHPHSSWGTKRTTEVSIDNEGFHLKTTSKNIFQRKFKAICKFLGFSCSEKIHTLSKDVFDIYKLSSLQLNDVQTKVIDNAKLYNQNPEEVFNASLFYLYSYYTKELKNINTNQLTSTPTNPVVSKKQFEILTNETANLLEQQKDPKYLYELGQKMQEAAESKEKGWELIQEAADLGHDKAQVFVANDFEGQKKYSKALEFYKKAADQGNSTALGYLGIYYAKGHGVKKNLDKALEYFTLSREKNPIYEYEGATYLAMQDLANMLKDVDQENAIRYYEEAEKGGIKNPMPLASLYFDRTDQDSKNLAVTLVIDSITSNDNSLNNQIKNINNLGKQEAVELKKQLEGLLMKAGQNPQLGDRRSEILQWKIDQISNS